MTRDAVRLSAYPLKKIVVSCDKCGRKARYDRDAMLEAGGDRNLPDMLAAIARRLGCEKVDNVNMYDRCRLIYANIPA